MKGSWDKGVIIVMGVSGSGKSTLGQKLAGALGLPFFDGDDYHSPENIQKMSAGTPLTDADRLGWLQRLNQLAGTHEDKGAVIACSALKEQYRQLLEEGLQKGVRWIYLKGHYEELWERMAGREGHYMPAGLLKSQLETLEEPLYGIHIPVSLPLQAALETALGKLQ